MWDVFDESITIYRSMLRGNPSDGGVDCNCSRNFDSMLSSATTLEMDIIITTQTNTREHQCNSKKPSPSTLIPNALVARSLKSTNNSTNDLHLRGERSRLAAIAGDQALYEEQYGSSLWQCSQEETAFIWEWRCQEDSRVFSQTEEEIRERSMKVTN
eukprot:scaffold20491_cov35-Cyclotella_meneghiniana.AAC.3